MGESDQFCGMCGKKAEQNNGSNGAKNKPWGSTATYQRFAPAAYGAAARLTTDKALIFIVIMTAAVTMLCCFLPFLEVSFFGKQSFTLFEIIEKASEDSNDSYIAYSGIVAVLGALGSFVCALGSLSNTSWLIGSFIFSLVGATGAFKVVSENLYYLAIGFTAYEFLSVLVAILSIVVLVITTHWPPAVNN